MIYDIFSLGSFDKNIKVSLRCKIYHVTPIDYQCPLIFIRLYTCRFTHDICRGLKEFLTPPRSWV